jgi:uncharacterized membrane protein YhfC
MLIAMVILAVVFMFALPLVLALVVTRRYQATWRTIGVGALGYLVTQSVVMLLAMGAQALLQNQLSTVVAGLTLATLLSYVLAGISCVIAMLSLWIGFRYLRQESDSWIGALALGIGFGGTESILMGVEAVGIFYPYVVASIAGMQSLGLSTTDAATLTSQLSTFLTTPWYFPFTYIVDRAAYMAVYLAVAVVAWQAFTKHKWTWLWLAGGMVWLILVQAVNNIVAAISTQSYWTELFLFVVMLISLEALYWFKVSVLDKQAETKSKPDVPTIEAFTENDTETADSAVGHKVRKGKKNK